MKIQRSKHNRNQAVVTLPRTSLWGGRNDYPDGRDLDEERRDVRAVAREFCEKHGLDGYEVFASARNGGFMLDQVQL